MFTTQKAFGPTSEGSCMRDVLPRRIGSAEPSNSCERRLFFRTTCYHKHRPNSEHLRNCAVCRFRSSLTIVHGPSITDAPPTFSGFPDSWIPSSSNRFRYVVLLRATAPLTVPIHVCHSWHSHTWHLHWNRLATIALADFATRVRDFKRDEADHCNQMSVNLFLC